MKVKIIATGKSEHMPKGTVYHESKEMAELLVKIGAATYEGEHPADAKANPKPAKKK